jgi:predicted ATP-dependent endonuclease of OLD family
MKLKKVNIVNYRSIKEETLDFVHECRVLVGINESGKSNILRALSLLSPEFTSEIDDQREPLPDEEEDDYDCPRISFVFDMTDSLETLIDTVSTKFYGSSRAKIIEKDGELFTLKQFIEGHYSEGVYNADVDDSTKYVQTCVYGGSRTFSVVSDWKKPASTLPAGTEFKNDEDVLVGLNDLKLIKPKEEWGIEADQLEDASFKDFNDVVEKEFNDLISANLPDVIYWVYDNDQLLPEKISLTEFMDSPEMCKPLKNMFVLAGISDIEATIKSFKARGGNSLNNLLRRVASKSTEYFQSVWQEYKDIKFALVVDGENIKCSVSEKNDYAFQKRSDGFKKFVAFLLTVSTRSHTGNLKNTLVLIDEPDSGLHPSGARYLRDEMIKISEGNFVVYSTHSIFMIDRHNIDRHIIVEKNGEVTTTKVADSGNINEEEVIFNAINYSTFEHLREVNILFEGWRDKKLAEVCTRSTERAFYEGVGMGHGNGVSSYRYLIPTLELAERKVLIVSDSDNAAKNAQRDYKKLGYKSEWKRYDQILPGLGAKTGEDFLKKDYLVSKFKTTTRSHGAEIDIPESNIPEDNRLNYLKQQLRANGFADNVMKDVMDDFKTSLFKTLTVGKVEVRYKDFLRELKAYTESTILGQQS